MKNSRYHGQKLPTDHELRMSQEGKRLARIAKSEHKLDYKPIYGWCGRLFESLPSRHGFKPIVPRLRLPEKVKIGKFFCMKHADGKIQVIFRSSLWNATFDEVNGKQVCKLNNRMVLV